MWLINAALVALLCLNWEIGQCVEDNNVTELLPDFNESYIHGAPTVDIDPDDLADPKKKQPLLDWDDPYVLLKRNWKTVSIGVLLIVIIPLSIAIGLGVKVLKHVQSFFLICTTLIVTIPCAITFIYYIRNRERSDIIRNATMEQLFFKLRDTVGRKLP